MVHFGFYLYTDTASQCFKSRYFNYMRLNTNNINPILSDLKDSDLVNLVTCYCFTDFSVSEIISQFNLTCSPRQLLHALPEVITDFPCPYCKQNMMRRILSKTHQTEIISDSFCPNCQHQDSTQCACYHCQKKKFYQENYFSPQAIISAFFDDRISQSTQQSLTDLSLKDAVYLWTLIRSSKRVSRTGQLGPLKTMPCLTPYGTKTVTQYLGNERRIIDLSRQSDEAAFTIKEGRVTQVDIMLLTFDVFINDFESSLIQLHQIIEAQKWPEPWYLEVKSIWQEIAVMECTQYFESVAAERDCLAGDSRAQIENMCLNLLQNYSVSECFSIIMSSVCRIPDDWIRRRLTVEVEQEIIQLCYQYTMGQYAIEKRVRPHDLPESQLSYVFHNEFLKIGHQGFINCPDFLSQIRIPLKITSRNHRP